MILSIASRNLRSSVADHAWREIMGLVVLAFLVGEEVVELELGVSLSVEGWSMGPLGGMIDWNENSRVAINTMGSQIIKVRLGFGGDRLAYGC
jgi:hypothetical protein